MKKVAMFVFNAFTNDSRVLKEATSLKNYGYDVAVIAHLDIGVKHEEVLNGVWIKRFSYLNRKKTKGTLGKLIAYAKYMKESIAYGKDFDILHCHDLNTLPIGYIIKAFFNKNVKIVYDAHEYETEIRGLTGAKKWFLKATERFLIKHTERVITVSNAIAEDYAKIYKIPKPALILNTPPYQNISKKDIFRQKFGITKDQTIFLYQGGLSEGRGIEILIEAFKIIHENHQKTLFQPCIVFMGYGPLENQVKNMAKKYDNIYFHPAVSPDVLLEYTSSADFGISMIEDVCLSYRYCLPNKMFEYIMADLPVIVSNLYEMKRLVEENNIGVVAKENTANGLHEAIIKAEALDRKELERNIKKIQKIYNWENQEKVLLETYRKLSK